MHGPLYVKLWYAGTNVSYEHSVSICSICYSEDVAASSFETSLTVYKLHGDTSPKYKVLTFVAVEPEPHEGSSL